MRISTTLILAFALCMAPAPAAAQSITGAIVGRVTDPSDAVVVGASVRAINVATGALDAAATDGAGFYRIANLVPGEYFVEVEAPGFQKTRLSAQRLSLADNLRLDVELELGETKFSVTIEDRASEVNTEDAQLGKVMRDIGVLPVLSTSRGRNVLQLAYTQPGTAPANDEDIAVNGQRSRQNHFVVDGATTNTAFTNWASSTPNGISPNAVEEFRLVTGPMKAEYGRSPGGALILTTKSGGNRFHGMASEVFRNRRLNAVPFFQKSVPGGTPGNFANGLPRKPDYKSHDFDANLGGPIRRNKTFFFASYLGFRRRTELARSATVPNDSERQAIEAFGTPQARALLALLPPANQGNTLFSNLQSDRDRDQVLFKIDHYFSTANRLAITYFREDSAGIDPSEGGLSEIPVPGFEWSDETRTQNLIVRDTHSFGPNLFHEFRAALQRIHVDAFNPANPVPPSSLGLDAIVPDLPDKASAPLVVIFGFSEFGDFGRPLVFTETTLQFIDNVSWTRGRHGVKFGGNFSLKPLKSTTSFLNNGLIVANGSGTASGLVPAIEGLSPPLNDFANGFAVFFQQGSTATTRGRTWSTNLFLQDDWKVKRNFTLNLGLRWEYNKGLTDTRDRVAALRPGQQSVIFPDAPAGLVYPGDAGISRSTYGEDWNNFAPRFGFAWDVLGNGRLALRGGYGLFYDLHNFDLAFEMTRTLPYVINPRRLFTDYANPWEGALFSPTTQPFPHVPPEPGGHFDFTALAPLTFWGMDPHLRTPYGQQWSLQVQYELRPNWLLEVGYVGSNGVKLYSTQEANPAVPGPGADVGNTDFRRILNQDHPQREQFGGAPFSNILQLRNDRNSNYNSLQVNLTKRFSRGFQTTHAYTWSHAIDSASDQAVRDRPDNGYSQRGHADHDRRHVYVGTYVYEFPWRRSQTGPLGRLVGGWGVSGMTLMRSGAPFDLVDNDDRCLCGVYFVGTPDYIGGEIAFYDPRSTNAVPGRPNSWFDGAGGGTPTAAPNPHFRRVGSGPSYELGAGRFGNFGRNVLRGPGFVNWQLAVFKRTRITERQSLEFRAGFFNLFNQAQFINPIGDIGSTNFGRILETAEPRIVQFSLRYMF